jgi:hypothetical protein
METDIGLALDLGGITLNLMFPIMVDGVQLI